MTDLQTSLMAIGGTIVVGVVTYNKWQEYKTRKSVEKAFSNEHDDVLMNPAVAPSTIPGQADRHEPTLSFSSHGQAAALAEEGADQLAGESIVETPVEQTHTHSVAANPTIPASESYKDLPVDEVVDCIVPLSMAAPARGDKLLPKLQSLRHVGNKPVHFIGQDEEGTWDAIVHGGVYSALMAGVQLANRSSTLNEIEYSEFIMKLRQIADDIDAEPDVPDMSDVMSAARSLHQFVSEYDAQLSVNVQSKGAPWEINALLAALERQGFDLRPDGRLVMPDGDGGALFTLSTNVTLSGETTARLTLLLDVPRVAPSRNGFGALTACARVLAGRLGGTVVDDGGQPLKDAALEEIAGQVNAFYRHMEDAGIAAGSVRALRLFS